MQYLNKNKDKSGFLPIYVLYGEMGRSEARVDQEGKINMLDNAFLILDLLAAYGGLCDSVNETDKATVKEIERFLNDLKWNLVFDEKTGLFPQHYYPRRPLDQRFDKAEGDLKEVYSEGFLAYLVGYLVGGLDIRWSELEQGAILNESPEGAFRWIPKTKHGALYQMPIFLYFDPTLNEALFKAAQNLVDASLRISAQNNYPLPPVPSPTPGSGPYRYSIGGLNDLAADVVDSSFSSPVGAAGFVEAVYPGKGLSLLGEVRRSIGSIPDSYTIRDGKVVPSLWSATDNRFFMTGGLFAPEVRSGILTALKRLPQGQKRYEQLQGILAKTITFQAVPSADEARKLKSAAETKNISASSLLAGGVIRFAFPMNIPEAHPMTGENKLTINYQNPADKWGGYGIKFTVPQNLRGKWINISYTTGKEIYIKCELKKDKPGGGEAAVGENQKILLSKTADGQTVSFLVPDNDKFGNVTVMTLVVETSRLPADDAKVTINIRDISVSDNSAGKRSGGINKHVPGDNYYTPEQIKEIDGIISMAEQGGNTRSLAQGHQRVADLIDRITRFEKEEDLRQFIIDTIGDTPLAERLAKKLFAISSDLKTLSGQLNKGKSNLHVNGRGLKLKEVRSPDTGFYPRHTKEGAILEKENALPIFDRIPEASQVLYLTEGFGSKYLDAGFDRNIFAQTILHSMLEYFFNIDHQDSSAMETLFNREESPASKGLQVISDVQKEYLSIAAEKKLVDYFPALFGAHEYDIDDSFRAMAVLEYIHAMENAGLNPDAIINNLRASLQPHISEQVFMKRLLNSGNEYLKTVLAIPATETVSEIAKSPGTGLMEKLDRIFARPEGQEAGSELVASLKVNGQRAIPYADNRENYLGALEKTKIKYNVGTKIFFGIEEITSEVRGKDTFRTIIVTDMSGNKFIVILKNGLVEEVAMPAKDAESGIRVREKYEFIIIDDARVRDIMQKKIDERAGGPVKTFASNGEAKIMSGLLYEREIADAKEIIMEDPLLAHLFGLVHDNYPGVSFRGFIVNEMPRDCGGYYDGKRIAIISGREFNREIYAHEITHHIYKQLNDAADRIGTSKTQSGDEKLAEQFQKIQDYFDRSGHYKLSNRIRSNKSYTPIIQARPGNLRNEILARIAGTVFDRKVIEPRSNEQITFGDIRLLVDLDILPKEIYGNPKLFEGIELSAPLPETFYQAAELSADEAGARRATDVESRDKETINALKSEEDPKSRDPIAVVGLPWWTVEELKQKNINPDAYLATLEKEMSRMLGKKGYGDPTNVHKFKLFFMEKDAIATKDNIQKALDAVKAGQEVVIFTPQINGALIQIDKASLERFGDQCTVIPDAYSDINTSNAKGFPDVNARITITRLVAWCKEAEFRKNAEAQKMALEGLTTYLGAITGEPIPPVSNLSDLLKRIDLLRIRPIDYKDITDWRDSYEAVATSL
jgi:hypothetical protein